MLELQNVTYTVTENNIEKNIIDHMDLVIPDGKFVVITGPNGGGKSTLAKTIMGINHISSGRLLFDGEDITAKNITERAKLGISFAFQQPVHFKGIKVIDLLRLATGKNISKDSACEYLSKVGLCAKEYINREVNNSLSGGELKRIEIATVLARGTKFSIFDEPEAGIDIWSFQNLIQVFENIRKTVQGTVLIISHQERILNIADEIVVIENGKVAKQGAKADILPELLGTASAVNAACSKLDPKGGF
ncbi:MAG: ATP-binding cassette domain-containing protein [Veillonellaceae bacterium]|uniref:ABC transporter ATP-binding protein n=1 Tax=Anaerovibrio lipolyticus TaxID=82374 RepID=UPI001F29846B|nr:ATP-binding cassette domain-containing protein [Anaerovibrio lipolyticus]MCI6911366.1 ATP-binding cassette domain-containing protein [Veillonellaceae bacterium]MDY4486060.1 ATP-binding cassette domain-containing protein [Anaerovibrio sp.]MCF2600748.1 ATP-binding cassette domain-containing protein [Anaerovibrio lipolyticus]MCI7078113.1 ATP-binding cassette domain-containing protein [Veillonellaceae bacterium]MCI7235871.1 ATP-binding cassette domain-containing protein [Veillonellaceae bacteri